MSFADVPIAPGVPPVPRPSGEVPEDIPLMTTDTVSGFATVAGPTWGIFDQNGNPAIVSDNVISFDYRQDWNLSDYPVEQGAFQTYNKVQVPFDVRFRFSTGGNDQDRSDFLATVETVAASLDLFDAVMPERVYQNINVSHYDMARRNDSGVGLLLVDVWALEIRENAVAEFTNTQSPAGANPINGGVLQTSVPTQAQLNDETLVT